MSSSSNKNTDEKIYSVSEAKRVVSGHITVTGMITGYSTSYQTISESAWTCCNIKCNLVGSQTYTPPLLLPAENLDNTSGYNLRCHKCKSDNFQVTHTYHNAVSIQLEENKIAAAVNHNNNNNNNDKTLLEDSSSNNNNSSSSSSSIDRLEVVLYDDAALHTVAGEVVDISGYMHIQRKLDSGSSKGKKLVNVLHSSDVRYKNKDKIIVTKKDIEIFHKHKKICQIAYQRELEAEARLNNNSGALTKHKIIPMKYIDRLVAMFAPNVIGMDDVKLGVLRSLVGGSRINHGDDNGRRGRINTLLVGDPGTAKSIIARESTKMNPNSRYVNAQNASGISLIGIVEKENDIKFLRLGVAVLAKDAILAVNEIGSLSPEDQGHLNDIAEEGKTTVTKYALHFNIDAPTTLIATANPYNAKWDSTASISNDEVPVLRTFLDRCDQFYGIKDNPSDKEVKDYTIRKSHLRKRKPHNYNFLRKLFTYSKTINPKITSDAEERLNDFWIRARLKDAVTKRTYDSIFRLAEAQAKLNLNDEVDDDIATQIMDSMSLMLLQYGKLVQTIESPRDITYNAFLNILKQTKAGLSVQELHNIACEENVQIYDYLGKVSRIQDNRKLRTIVDMLLQHSSIKQVQQKPLVLQWMDGSTSSSDDGNGKSKQASI